MTQTRNEIADRLMELDELYVSAIQAYAPPNIQFERDRIIRSLVNKREMAYVCGFLSEGENEAALIIELMSDMLGVNPAVNIDHLREEAWYYLRSSIDATWQLDPNPPQISVALDYLMAVVRRRTARVATTPFGQALADTVETDARALMSATR